MTKIHSTQNIYNSTFGPIYLKSPAEKSNIYLKNSTEGGNIYHSVSCLTINLQRREPIFVSRLCTLTQQSGHNFGRQLTAIGNHTVSSSPLPSSVNKLVFSFEAGAVNNHDEFIISLEKTVPSYEHLSTHAGVVKYGKLCWLYENENFSYSKSALDVFIHFSKSDQDDTTRQTSLPGDKWHVSVNIDKVSQAFDLLASTLLSKDINLFEWKITDMNDASRVSNTDRLNRVRYGAQFTLYFHPLNNKKYTEDEFNKIRNLGRFIENTLKNAEIIPGYIPDSDIVCSGFDYISYRNDELIPSNDKINKEEKKMLLSQEFFKRSFADNSIKENNNSSMEGYYYEGGLKMMPCLFV